MAIDKKMSDARLRVIKQVKALGEKTVENGCTEAEALAALNKMQKLIDDWEIDLTAEDQAEDRGVVDSSREYRFDIFDRLGRMISSIATYTNSAAIMEKTSRKHAKVIFVGPNHEAKLATTMFELFANTLSSSWKAFQKTDEYKAARESSKYSYQCRYDYVLGFSQRMAERIQELGEAREENVRQRTGGQELIVSKRELTEQLVRDKFPNLKDGKQRGGPQFMGSFKSLVAGIRSANEVDVEGAAGSSSESEEEPAQAEDQAA